MAKRFGRNQRRKMREHITQLEERLHYMPLADDALHVVRQTVRAGIGVNCTFICDDVALLVGLAQRAVLAGLDADCDPDMRTKFSSAAEPYRSAHEEALGRQIGKAQP